MHPIHGNPDDAIAFIEAFQDTPNPPAWAVEEYRQCCDELGPTSEDWAEYRAYFDGLDARDAEDRPTPEALYGYE